MREQDFSRPFVRRQRAGLHLDRAERLERAGRLDEAMSEFKAAVELDPDIADAQEALGYHYRRKGLLAKALDAFRRAAALADDYESLYALGHVLTDMTRYDEAVQVFQRCLALRPGDCATYYELAYAHYGAGRYAQCLDSLAGVTGDCADDWETPYLHASCSLRLGAYAVAQADLDRALGSAPEGDARTLLLDTRDLCERYGEFLPTTPLGVKDRLYAEYGAVCLGSAQDDGLAIPQYEEYRLDYADVAVTLNRFVALYLALDVRASVVLPADAQALPLAIALGELLRIPLACVEQVTENDLPLAVLGVCSGPELLDVLLEQLPEDAVSLALAVGWSGHSEFVADAIGVLTRKPGILPWKCDLDWNTWGLMGVDLDTFLRLNPYGKAAEALVARLLRACGATRDEPARAKQLSYYLCDHARSRLGRGRRAPS